MFSWNNFLGKLTNNLLGIVNITNDSFSDDGLLNKQEKIPEVYETASKKGINFLDIGCMSTKPNFKSNLDNLVTPSTNLEISFPNSSEMF